MASTKQSARVKGTALIVAAALLATGLAFCAPLCAQSAANPQQPAASNSPPPPGRYVSPLPRGTKLMLKDGSYQLASEYEIQGDRVRYYSVERSQWEVIPTAIVDWAATRKAEAEEEKSRASLVSKVKKQEEEQRAVAPLDIDASLEVAHGVFLPPGEGLFVFDGKAVLQVPQAKTTSQISKTRFLERVLMPVPIIPARQTISIPGERAKFRLNSHQPEFYLRTGNASEPNVVLVRAKVHHGKRQIMHLDQLMGQEQTSGDTLALQRWVIAKGVYRYTLSKKLPKGEYVIAEMLPNQGMSMYVWDFGVN